MDLHIPLFFPSIWWRPWLHGCVSMCVGVGTLDVQEMCAGISRSLCYLRQREVLAHGHTNWKAQCKEDDVDMFFFLFFFLMHISSPGCLEVPAPLAFFSALLESPIDSSRPLGIIPAVRVQEDIVNNTWGLVTERIGSVTPYRERQTSLSTSYAYRWFDWMWPWNEVWGRWWEIFEG